MQIPKILLIYTLYQEINSYQKPWCSKSQLLMLIWLTGNKENQKERQDAWTRITSYLIAGHLDSSGPQEIQLALM